MPDEQVVPVGSIAFYNCKGNLSKTDLERIASVRKLIGSSLLKAQIYTDTLQTIVGMQLRKDQLKQSSANVDCLMRQDYHVANLYGSIKIIKV